MRSASAFGADGVCSAQLQNFLQVVQVIVAEDAQLGAAEPGGIHDAGMHQFIQDDDVILVQQCADRADGRGVAGGKAERGLGAFEGGERFFQFAGGAPANRRSGARRRRRRQFSTASMAASLSAGSLASPR